jgi:hypothetical protein
MIDRPLSRVRPNFLRVLRRGIETIRAMTCYALLLLAAPVNESENQLKQTVSLSPSKSKVVVGLRCLGFGVFPACVGRCLWPALGPLVFAFPRFPAVSPGARGQPRGPTLTNKFVAPRAFSVTWPRKCCRGRGADIESL